MSTTVRRDARAPVTMKIKFKSASLDQFIERYAVDVSRGGIFIRTREPLGVGTPIRFEFQLQDSKPLISGEGTVVWVRDADPGRANLAPGMGVRFDRLPPDSQLVLDKILLEKDRLEGAEAESFAPEAEGATRVGDAVDLSALGAGGAVGIRSGGDKAASDVLSPSFGTGQVMAPNEDEVTPTGFEAGESTRVMSNEQMEVLAEKLRSGGDSTVKPIPIPRPVAPPVRRTTEMGMGPTPVPPTALRSDPPRQITQTFGSHPPGSPSPSGAFGEEVSRLPPPPPVASVPPTTASAEAAPDAKALPPSVPPAVPTAAPDAAPPVPSFVFEPQKLEPQSIVATGPGLSNGANAAVPALEDHWSVGDSGVTSAAQSESSPSTPSEGGWFGQEGTSDPVRPVIRNNGTGMSGSGLLPPPAVMLGGIKRSRTGLLIAGVSVLVLGTLGVVWWTGLADSLLGGKRVKTRAIEPPPSAAHTETRPSEAPVPTGTAPTPQVAAAPTPPEANARPGSQPSPVVVAGAPTPALVEPKPLGASIVVDSTPPGAKIVLDGQEQAMVTPSTLEGIDTNKMHSIRLMLSGHRAFETRLGPGTLKKPNVEINATLKALPGQVEILSTPPGAQVLLEGRPVGKTPCTVKNIALERKRRLEIKKDGYATITRELSPTEAWQDEEDHRTLSVAVSLVPTGAAGVPAPVAPTAPVDGTMAPKGTAGEADGAGGSPSGATPSAAKLGRRPGKPSRAEGGESTGGVEAAGTTGSDEGGRAQPAQGAGAPNAPAKEDDIKVPDWATK